MSPEFTPRKDRQSGMFREGSQFVSGERSLDTRLSETNLEQSSAQEALREIANIAIRFTVQTRSDRHEHGNASDLHNCSVCSGPRPLPRDSLVTAAETATRINPVNMPAFYRNSAIQRGFIAAPENIAALTSKYWGPSPRKLTVSFMDSPAADLRARIVSHMNAWTKTGCISFVETRDVGQVRISRGQGGYWSYLGTDILHISPQVQTMNLEGFTMNTPEREYTRVVRHETGHTLGFPHEHMRRDIIARIDRTKIYDYALRTFGWDQQTVDEQILTPIDERSILPVSTRADQFSIMCYQLPGSVTTDGEPIVGGTDIDESDYDFCGLIYPKPTQAVADNSMSDYMNPQAFKNNEARVLS